MQLSVHIFSNKKLLKFLIVFKNKREFQVYLDFDIIHEPFAEFITFFTIMRKKVFLLIGI